VTISAQESTLPAVLFDLDGTLVDPAGGISSGIAYALRVMDLPVPSDEVLAAMIGPKLSDSLLDYTQASPEQLPELIGTYRTWYAEQGIAMGQAYPGIRTLLQALRREGYALAVATQKPEGFAKILLETHGLASSFDIIVGSSDDETLMPGDPGYRSGKTEIIAAALAGLRERPGREPAGRERPGREPAGGKPAGTAAENAVMVGDRAQDVNGAAGNSLECIGVAWGFALPGELEAAGAVAVVGTAEALLAEITRRLKPGNTVPADAVPAEVLPAEALPGDAVPAEAMPADTVLAGAGGRSAGRGYPGEAPDGAL